MILELTRRWAHVLLSPFDVRCAIRTPSNASAVSFRV